MLHMKSIIIFFYFRTDELPQLTENAGAAQNANADGGVMPGIY